MDTDYISVSETARLLGVHKNTVRHRIKVGALPAQKVLTAYGEAYQIPRSALDLPLHEESKPVQDDWSPNPSNPSNAGALVTAQQQAQMEALLRPFVQEIGQVREELGRVKAERDAALQRLADLEAHAAAEPADSDRRRWWQFWR